MTCTVLRQVGQYKASITWDLRKPHRSEWFEGIMGMLCQVVPTAFLPALPEGLRTKEGSIFVFSAKSGEHPGSWDCHSSDEGMLLVGMALTKLLGSSLTGFLDQKAGFSQILVRLEVTAP
jgi:hypothetical protein